MLHMGDLEIVNCTEIFIHRRQMLPQEPPIKQDLQQTHTKTQLHMHAKHENYHRITSKTDTLKCSNNPKPKS